mmetsp:Transcript_50060/g.150653  ORF Transcript_50060/g.150653 Transcript_50060/m.150653 type:complete len:204 (+) Transcript_50060:828-1439(+)
MGFVNNSHTPRNLAHHIKVSYEGVICSYQYIELQIFWCMRPIHIVPFIFPQHITPNTLPIVVNTALKVGPTLKFTSPVLDCRKRNHHEKWALNIFNTMQMLDIGNNLHRLPQTHFVCQYATISFIVARCQPVHSVDLVITEPISLLINVRILVIIKPVAKLCWSFALIATLARRLSCDFSVFVRMAPPVATHLISVLFAESFL